jgi:hypothetical protein
MIEQSIFFSDLLSGCLAKSLMRHTSDLKIAGHAGSKLVGGKPLFP